MAIALSAAFRWWTCGGTFWYSTSCSFRYTFTTFIGNKKALAAGADIKGMLSQNYAQILQGYQTHWSVMSKIRKPIVAAINGYVLAGGKII